MIRGVDGARKFFCIGVFRSGTTSTRKYLESLGLDAVDWNVISTNLKNYPHNMGPIDESLANFDVFGDIPYNYMDFIERMIHEYPRALFFLSTRDESDWLGSVKRHRVSRVEGVSNLITEDTLREAGVVVSNDEEMKASYVARNNKVVKMFEEANQGHRLCTFSIDDSNMKKSIEVFLIGHGFVVDRGVSTFPWEERTE
jgi:hypothetical protein